MVLDIILGFVLLVAASYIGTTMALRGFFGREYYDRKRKWSTATDDDQAERTERDR